MTKGSVSDLILQGRRSVPSKYHTLEVLLALFGAHKWPKAPLVNSPGSKLNYM